jgi:hypothetical protein
MAEENRVVISELCGTGPSIGPSNVYDGIAMISEVVPTAEENRDVIPEIPGTELNSGGGEGEGVCSRLLVRRSCSPFLDLFIVVIHFPRLFSRS